MTKSPGELWGAADYERIAKRFAAIQDGLVEALALTPGERVLDVATGTGEVALRASRLGARVRALDIAPALLEQAQAKAARERLPIEWMEGNAEQLPYEDGSFDVVCSNFGVIFAEIESAAAELARVCRAGGRLGLTAWKPNEGLRRIYAAFDKRGEDDPAQRWGDEECLEKVFGGLFDLRCEERIWTLTGDSPEDVWELITAAAPPVKAFVEKLDPARLAEFRSTMLDYWRGFEAGGAVAEPRAYLLVLGRRR